MTKAKANKRNSRQSTGPRTAKGKAVVAGNALQHGILSAKLFLAGESQEDFFYLDYFAHRFAQAGGCFGGGAG